VAQVIKFTAAMARVAGQWGAQVSPMTTVGQVVAAITATARYASPPAFEVGHPMRLESRLDMLGIRPGDRVLLVDGTTLRSAIIDLGGVRALHAQWAGGEARSDGRARLVIGSSDPQAADTPDIDLRSAAPNNDLPRRCAILRFDPLTENWALARVGDARVLIDDLDLPPDTPVTLNADTTVRLIPSGASHGATLQLHLGEPLGTDNRLPLGMFALTAWRGDETRPLTLRASLNLPVSRLVGGLAGQMIYPSGGQVYPYLMQLAGPQTRLIDLGEGAIVYLR